VCNKALFDAGNGEVTERMEPTFLEDPRNDEISDKQICHSQYTSVNSH